jgi:hypothetical protein
MTKSSQRRLNKMAKLVGKLRFERQRRSGTSYARVRYLGRRGARWTRANGCGTKWDG